MVWDEKTNKPSMKNLKETISPSNFSFKQTDNSSSIIVTIYGMKGEGKTAFALNEKYFNGKISCLSFDNKTVQVKKYYYDDTNRIKVYNAIEHYTDDPDTILQSAEKTYQYCLFLLDNIAEKDKPDWILIDGLEIFAQIGEMVMRHRNALKPFSGVPNPNIWKTRKLILRAIHKKAVAGAKKGVIYTTYTDKDEIIEDGNVKTKDKIPKWTDVVLWETDIVVYVYSKTGKMERRFFYDVISSKIDSFFQTGKTEDITKIVAQKTLG